MSKVQRKCLNCQKDFIYFTTSITSGKYCSWACYSKKRPNRKKERIIKKCEECGKEFKCHQCVSIRRKYCSKKCKNAAWESPNPAFYATATEEQIKNRALVLFERNTAKENDCELYIRLDQLGYGNFRYKNKSWKAHRLKWELINGPIPKGMHVIHSCDIRNCVKISHLRIGTHTDNMRDMISKGRASWQKQNYKDQK